MRWCCGLIMVLLASPAWCLESLELKSGPYVEYLDKKITEEKDPVKDKAMDFDHSIKVACLKNEDHPLYILAAQYYSVVAPLAQVEKVLREFSAYPQLFDGLVDIKVEELGTDLFSLAMEQSVPVPFASNIKTTMKYKIEKDRNKVIFRYHLVKSNNLNFYDGFILLKAVDDQHTEIKEFDFWDADWGIAKMVGTESLYNQSLQAIYQTDLAIKWRSEKSDESYREIKTKSIAAAKEQSFKKCFRERVTP